MSAVLRPQDTTPRRGLRRDQAAAYIGVSPSKFGQMVASGELPAGFAIGGCVVWDVHDLDAAFDAMKYAVSAPSRPMELDRL